MHRMRRMPARLLQQVPQRKQMPGRGQKQAGCPGPPPHTCCPDRGSGPGMGGPRARVIASLCPWAQSALSGPQDREGPKVPTSQGFRRPLREEQKGPLTGNLRAAWIPQHGCSQGGAAQNRWDRCWTSSDDPVASSKGPPLPEPQFPSRDRQQGWSLVIAVS